MMTYVEGQVISETVDRAAIRDLVDSWAHCADRRLPRRQAELFTTDGVVLVYAGDPASNEPVQRLQGHDELAEAFTVLNNYDVTSHVNAQSTVTLAGDARPVSRTASRTTCGWRTGSGCC
jgi:hypothetical protein